jgi:hypothetical protein
LASHDEQHPNRPFSTEVAVNKKIAAGVLAGLLAGGAAGVTLGVPALSGAQESPTTTAPADEAPADAPDESARPERGQWLEEALAPLVADGTITQAQADAVIAALREAKPDRGPGGPGGHGRGFELDAAAAALGMAPDDLRTALRDGQSLAEVAQSKGIDPQVVIDAMVAELKTHLDEEVAAGEHTQEEADEFLARATERITALVNGEFPEGRPGFGGRMWRGDRGFGPGGAEESTTESTGTSA